jgi:hypothetical protein
VKLIEFLRDVIERRLEKQTTLQDIKMTETKKFRKQQAIITLLLSQVRAGSKYCQRTWQKITAANKGCEQYKVGSKLSEFVLVTHISALWGQECHRCPSRQGTKDFRSSF